MAALAGRYAVEREIGQGGMATVYLAQDLRHGRRVAIKVLRPEIAIGLGPERFLREVAVTAQLDHPHIVPLLDSGEGHGLVYYVMPFVEGETLRQRLAREKQLSLEDAGTITRDIAGALAYAHGRGVLHRDIKPDNIILSGLNARIMDFGIAKAAKAAVGDTLTEAGMVLGTPAYMSPEQLAGGRDLDARSDLYSLGCVAYEMLAGQPPFTGPTIESLAYQHLTVAPAPVTQFRSSVPRAVAAVLQKALAKVPADRYQGMQGFAEAFATALQRPVGGAKPFQRFRPLLAAGALVAIIAVAVLVRGRASRNPSDRPSVAVLPFRNLGPPEEQYFADGITEEISARLSHISGLTVISRGSALQYKASTRPVGEIARELGVQYVLEGTVRTDRKPDGTGQVRVAPQLIRVQDVGDLPMDTYTTGLTPGEVFQTQSQIAERVAEALNVRLIAAERETVRGKQTVDAQAYDSYLLGRFQLNATTAEGVEKAIAHFEAAAAHDSLYAQAFAGLADAYAQVNFWPAISIPVATAYARAEAAARRAIALDGNLADAHASLGNVLASGRRDWDGAEREFRRAIALDSTYALARAGYADLLWLYQRYPEALAEIDYAVHLEPTSPVMRHQRAMVLTFLNRIDEAVAEENVAIALQPGYRLAHVWLAQIAMLRSDVKQVAREMLATPNATIGQALEAFAAEPRTRSRLIAEIAALDSPNVGLNAARQAWLYAVAGAPDSVLASLERVVRSHSTPGLAILRFPSVTRLVGGSPRYAALMADVGLKP